MFMVETLSGSVVPITFTGGIASFSLDQRTYSSEPDGTELREDIVHGDVGIP
jgi:hypothetical protein